MLDLEKLSYRELQKLGKEYGLRVVGMKKAVLLASIQEVLLASIQELEEIVPVIVVENVEIFNMKELSENRIRELIQDAGTSKKFFAPTIVDYLQRLHYYNLRIPIFERLVTEACVASQFRKDVARTTRER